MVVMMIGIVKHKGEKSKESKKLAHRFESFPSPV